MKYNGLIISDIHFGALDSKILYDELEGVFMDCLRAKSTEIQFVVISGDLFDTKISLNSSHARYAFKFLQNLIDLCRDNEIKLRIIKGTEFHDNKQLELIPHLITEDCDVRIISTVEDEYLFPDMKVLYIPEEYMDDMNEYYKDYFNKYKEYDMIFGHGMLEEVRFAGLNQESEVTMKKAPYFPANTLIHICKGPIFFGHIHTSQTISEQIHYVGSYSRWIFGEEKDKGFMEVYYDTETSSSDVVFHKNTMARLFNTIKISDVSFYELSDSDKYNKIIDFIEDQGPETFIRLRFIVPEKYSSSPYFDILQKSLSSNKKIKIEINKSYERDKKRKERNIKIDEILSAYGFILDKGISDEERISKFIKLKYSKDISKEDVLRYTKEK